MKSFTTADLETMARGQKIRADVFRAVLNDEAAVPDLVRMLQVRELHDEAGSESDWPAVPDMNVTFDELTRYAERRLHNLDRVQAVERFLEKHFPEDLNRLRATAASADTVFGLKPGDTFLGAEDTSLDFRAKGGKGGKEGAK